MSEDTKPEVKADAPRYKLTEAAYIDDKLLAPEDTIEFRGIPGHHMLPLNESAKAMKKKYNKEFIDPIEAMTIVS